MSPPFSSINLFQPPLTPQALTNPLSVPMIYSYTHTSSLVLFSKAQIKCTLLFVFASRILTSMGLGGIDIWVGSDLMRLKGGGWSRKTDDRQSCTVCFSAFSCDSYQKTKRDHKFYMITRTTWYPVLCILSLFFRSECVLWYILSTEIQRHIFFFFSPLNWHDFNDGSLLNIFVE